MEGDVFILVTEAQQEAMSFCSVGPIGSQRFDLTDRCLLEMICEIR